jgi:hypothetical protein
MVSVDTLSRDTIPGDVALWPGDVALWPGDVALWPGDVALSCNPSYLGGQSSGMVRCGKPSSGQQMDILGRIKAFFSVMETGCALMSK